MAPASLTRPKRILCPAREFFSHAATAKIGPQGEPQMTELIDLDVDDLAVMMAALLIAAGYDAEDGARLVALMVADEMTDGATIH